MLAVAVGSTLYLIVSFAVMRRFTQPRPFAHSLRALWGEALAIAITQPLVPLYYFIGRRMGGPDSGRPIILVHGYFQNRADFVLLAKRLARASLGPVYGFNYNWASRIATSAVRLERFVDQVCRETGQPTVAIVAHSLGGVVAHEYIATATGAARVSCCVTIASPHAGVRWRAGAFGAVARELHAKSDYMQESSRRPVPAPVRAVSIYSSHDNIVHPPSTSALAERGGVDRPVEGVGHLGILFSREVAEATVRALAE